MLEQHPLNLLLNHNYSFEHQNLEDIIPLKININKHNIFFSPTHDSIQFQEDLQHQITFVLKLYQLNLF